MKLKKLLLTAVLSAAMFISTGCSVKDGSADNDGSAKDNESAVQIVTGESSVGNIGDITLADGDLIAEFDIKDYGVIKAKLFPESAPLGVENFQKLADSGYYKGLTVHRVMSDFMIQGGSLNGDGTGGDALVNDGAFGIEPDLDNARHFYGALCYANAMGSNSTQFYIVNNKTPQDLAEFNTQAYLDYAAQYEMYADAYKDDPDAYAYYSFQANYYRTTADAVTSASDEAKAKYKQVGGTPFLDGNYTVFGQVYDGFDVLDKISAAEVADNGSDEASKPKKDIIINDVKVMEFNSAE